MRKATGAVLYHCTGFKNQDYRHAMCPDDENGWCKYQPDKINGRRNIKIFIFYIRIFNIFNIFHIIKSIFQDLSKIGITFKVFARSDPEHK